MLNINKFKVDVNAVNDGTWVKVDEECRLLIARYNNPAFKQELERLRAPYRQLIRKDELSDEVAEELLNKAMARTILLGWEGIELDGVAYPYSKENCEKLLMDPAYKEFRDLVLAMSNDNENFRVEELQETGKG